MAKFADQWEDSKVEFEKATNKKKPRESLKQKIVGTGVGKAFRELDGMTSPKDIVKQVDVVKVACATYLKTLDKAANDPKDVDPTEKGPYLQALEKLRKALARLQSQALLVGDSLDPKDKKTETTAESTLKPIVEKQLQDYTDFVKLRESMIGEVKKWLIEGKTIVQKVGELASESEQNVKDITIAKNKGEATAADLLCKANQSKLQNAGNLQQIFARKCVERTETLLKVREEGALARTKSIDEKVLNPLKERSSKAWNTINPLQTEYLEVLPRQVAELVLKIERHVEEAEDLVGTVRPPEEYLSKFGPKEAELQNSIKEVDIAIERFEKQINEFPAKLEKAADTAAKAGDKLRDPLIIQVVNTWGSTVKANTVTLNTNKERLKVTEQLGRQLTSIPKDALNNKQVGNLVDKLNELLKTAADKLQKVVKLIEQANEKFNGGGDLLRSRVKELMEKK